MFDPTKKASDSSQSSEQSQQKLSVKTATNRSTPSPGAAAVAFSTPEEQQSFEYFTHRTADLISNYSHRPFWKKVLPQTSQQHPAVKHSVLALSILHQSLAEEGCLSERNNERMINHYNVAIRAITQGQPSIEIVLMTCIMFWAIETCNHSAGKPQHHIEAAVKILEEFKTDQKNKALPHWEVITVHIEPVVKAAHLQVHYSQLNLPSELIGMIDSYGVLELGLPPAFTNLADATFTLKQCIRCLLKMLNDRHADIHQTRADLKVMEAHTWRWLGLFHSLGTVGDAIAGRMLLVHHVTILLLIGEITKSVVSFSQDSAKDKLRATWIMRELEEITDTPVTTTSTGGPSKVQSHELGIIPPLFVVALLSGELALKAQALVLLAKIGRIEGHWKSSAAAKVAEIVIDMRTRDETEWRLDDLVFNTDATGLVLYRNDTAESVPCPTIWSMLKEIEEVDLVSVPHNETVRN